MIHAVRGRGRSAGRVVLLALSLAPAVPGAPGSVAAQEAVPDGLAYVEGDPAAPLTVTEFLDFGCPACAAFAATTLPVVRREYIETSRVRWRTVPFVLGSFRHSAEAARAAWCADRQGRFRAMHDALFAEREAWSGGGDPDEALIGLASSLGLDGSAFRGCYRSEAAEERVERQTRAARRARVRATPTFLIGDRTVLGALPPGVFRPLLDEALPEPGGGARESAGSSR